MTLCEYIRLAARWRENPLLCAHLQGRRGRVGMWRAGGALLVNTAVVLVFLAYALDAGGQESPLIIAMGAPFLVPIFNLLLFLFLPHRHVRKEHLEEYHLTQMTREEVVVGVTLPPVILSLAMVVPWVIGLAVSVGMRSYSDDDLLVFLVLSLPLVGYWITVLAIVMRRWLANPQSFLRLVATSVADAILQIAAFICLSMLSILALVTLGSGGDEEWAFPTGVGIAAFVISFAKVRQTLRFAGERFFSRIDPDSFRQAYWLANEARQDEREEARAAMAATLPTGTERRNALLLAMLVTVLIGLPVLFAGRTWYSTEYQSTYDQSFWPEEPRTLQTERALFGYTALGFVAACFPAIYILMLAQKRHGTPLVPSGVVLRSLWRLLIPVYAILVPWFLVPLARQGQSLQWWDPFFPFLLYLAVLLTLPLAAALVALPRRRRHVRTIAWVGLALTAHACAVLTAEMYSYGGSNVIFFESDDDLGFILCGAAFVFAIMLFFGPDRYGQLAHSEELRQLPRFSGGAADSAAEDLKA